MTTTTIGKLAVKRSIEIEASPQRVWEEFESAEKMRQWYTPAGGVDMNCKEIEYEPHVGGVFTTKGVHDGTPFHFVGKVLVYDPPTELTMDMDWVTEERWPAPTLLTFLLTPLDGGRRTRVDLYHHGFEGLGDAAEEMYRGFEGGWTTLQLECIKNLVEIGRAAR